MPDPACSRCGSDITQSLFCQIANVERKIKAWAKFRQDLEENLEIAMELLDPIS